MADYDLSTLRGRTFQRLRGAIDGAQTDAHAAFHYYTYPFYWHATGVSLHDYFQDPRVTYETQGTVLEQLSWCGDFSPDTGAVAECSALGCEIRTDQNGFLSVKPAGVNELEQALKLKPADPYGDNYMHLALQTLEYMCDRANPNAGVNAPFIQGPTTIAAQLCGISDFCEATLLDEDLVHALLDVATQSVIAYIQAIEKVMGPRLRHILIADDLSSFLNRTGYREFALPEYRKIFAQFPQLEFWLHNDMNADHIADLIAEAGFRAWQHGPHADVALLRERTAGSVVLLGGLQPLKLAQMGAAEAYESAVEALRGFAGDRKMALSACGSLNEVSPQSALAVLRAADEYRP